MASLVTASFDEPAAAARAIRAAREAGFSCRAWMPAPFPDVIEALGRPASKLGWATFLGASLGVSGGFALATFTSLAWPLVTGGKPILSWPPFVIVSFESSVLLAAAGTVLGLIGLIRRGKRTDPGEADPRFTADRIGVRVLDPSDPMKAEQILREAGALEVRRA